MNRKQMGRRGGLIVAAIACLASIPLSGLSADSPMSSWLGVNTVWTNTANWSAGVPNSASLGAVFDRTFSIQPDIATLPWSYAVGGIWLKSGVGQDVTINASTPIPPILVGATLNGLTAAGLLMDDSGNHNLTFGPNVTVVPGNDAKLYVYNGTLTIQGTLNGANGSGFTLIGTSTSTTINITGKLGVAGGGQIFLTSNTTVLASSSTYAGGIVINGGAILRENHVDATKNGLVSFGNLGVLQLRSDNNGDRFCSGGSVGMTSYYTGIVDVNRLDPVGGTASNNTLCLQTVSLGGTLSVTGGNGYSLSIANVTVLGGTSFYLSPTTANLIVGGIAPSTLNGTGATLTGTGSSNTVSGSIANASTGPSSFQLTKSGSCTWTLGGTNTFTGSLGMDGGTLIAANNYALGFGGAARINDSGAMTIGANSAPAPILVLSGVTVNKAISQNRTYVTLVNSSTNIASTLDSGLASITFTNGGTGFVGADVGKALTISGGGGSGAAAVIVALSATTNTIANVIGTGTGWNTGNTITLVGGGASQSAVYTVAAGGGVITSLTLSTPGYGYTSAPTNFTQTGSGTGVTPTYVQNFSVASISLTNAGNGYTPVPVVGSTVGSGSGLGAYANLSSLGLQASGVAQIGGDGKLTINAAITNGASATLTKIGVGVLILTASNTYASATTVSNGTLSACNTAGSATGSGTLTVLTNATFSGSGYIVPTGASGAQVTLNAGAHLSPHVGTGASNATLHVNVSSSSAANALNIAGGTIFDYNFGAVGASDTLSVTGKVTLAAGTNVLNIGQLAGFGAGSYPLITSSTTVTYNVTGWALPSSTHWVYSITNTTTAVTLNVVPAAPRATVIQIM